MQVQKTSKDIFISYGRRESKAFATKLYSKLSEMGLEAWFDQVNIPKGDDFQKRIDNGIESADNFIFIIAPHSLKSVFCLKEIELAVSLNKRIIPILHIEPTDNAVWDKMHPTIGNINWIYAREEMGDIKQLEKWKPLDSFNTAFEDLTTLLGQDKEYIKSHTYFLEKALEWKIKQNTSFLLAGDDRNRAEEWIFKEFIPPAQPPCQPANIHCEYICESRKNAENLMTDVFISYASETKDLRTKVGYALSRNLVTTWTHDKDIQKGTIYETAIHQGIEEADNFLFFISKESIVSHYCKKEIEYAISLNKRIIPLLIEEVDDKKVPKEIQALQYIDFTDNTNEADFIQDIKDLLEELDTDKDYFHKSKQFLTQALKWKEQKEKQSILLRGFNLEEAKTWLDLGKTRKTHKPTELHTNFINESIAKTGQLNTEVFICYSRNDADFGRKLNNQLQFNGKTTWFDQESIAGAAIDFEAEIYKGIESSDNFLFILSPNAVASDFCVREVEYAANLNKRFIVLFYAETPQDKIPASIAKTQWIDFNTKSFDPAFSDLIRAIEIDREYIQEHTRWSQKALEWESGGHSHDLLLIGKALSNAKNWLQDAIKEEKTPIPTEVQQKLIKASRKQARKTQLRYTIWTTVFIVITLLSLFSYWKSEESDKAFKRAERSAKRARISEKDAILAKNEADSLRLIAEGNTIILELKQDTLNNTLSNMDILLERVSLQKNKAEKAKYETEIAKQQVEAVAMAFKSREISKNDPTRGLLSALAAYKEVPEQPPHDAISALYDAFYNAIEQKKSFYKSQLKGHSDVLSDIAFSPDGEKVVTAAADNAIKLWDISKNNKLKTLKGHKETISKILFSSNNKLIVSASADNTIRLWNAKGKPLKTLKQHSYDVLAIALSPNNNKKLYSADKNGELCIWQLPSGKLLKKISAHDDAITDIKITKNGNRFLTVSEDRTIKLWNRDGDLLQKLDKHNDIINSAVFSPDEKLILSASNDGTAKLWDANSGTLLASFENTKKHLKKEGEEELSYKVTTAAFSPNGEEIFAAFGNYLKIWNITKISNGFASRIGELKENLALVRLEDSTKVILKPQPTRLIKGHSGIIEYFTFSPDGTKILTTSADKTARIWTLDGKVLHILSGHKKPIIKAIFSPDGKTIITASEDKTALIWDVDNHLPTMQSYERGYVNFAAPSKNRDKILITSDKKLTILTADINPKNTKEIAYKLTQELPYDKVGLFTSVFSNDEKQIVSSLTNNTSLIWTKSDSSGTYKPTQILKGHTDQVYYSEFSPNGKKVLTVSLDSTIQVRNRQRNMQFDTLAQSIKFNDYCFFAHFSPDGKRILTATTDTAFIYSTPTKYRKSKKLAELVGHKGSIYYAAFSPNGNRVITVATDESAILWERKKGSQQYSIIKRMEGHSDIVFFAAFSPDGKNILTSSYDKTTKIWTSEGILITTIKGEKEKVQTAFFMQGNHQIVTATSKKIKVWLTDKAIVKWLKNAPIYNFSPKEKEALEVEHKE